MLASTMLVLALCLVLSFDGMPFIYNLQQLCTYGDRVCVRVRGACDVSVSATDTEQLLAASINIDCEFREYSTADRD